MTLVDPIEPRSPTFLQALELRVTLERPVVLDEAGNKALGDINYRIPGGFVVLDQLYVVLIERRDPDITNLLTTTERNQLRAIMIRLAGLITVHLPPQP